MLSFQRLDVYKRAIDFLSFVIDVVEIARGEAMECMGSIDVLRLRSLISEEDYSRGADLLERIVGMLTKLVEAAQRGG